MIKYILKIKKITIKIRRDILLCTCSNRLGLAGNFSQRGKVFTVNYVGI
jgi:hypothetical protein